MFQLFFLKQQKIWKRRNSGYQSKGYLPLQSNLERNFHFASNEGKKMEYETVLFAIEFYWGNLTLFVGISIGISAPQVR